MLDSHNTCQHEAKGKRWSYGHKETDKKLWLCIHAVYAMQDFADRQYFSSKAMQCKTIYLISSHKLLQTAAEYIAQLSRSFDAVLNEASTIASTWGFPRQFLNKKAKKTKAYFDEISEGITLSDPKKRFFAIVFLFMMDYFLDWSLWRNEISGDVISSFGTKFSIKSFSSGSWG